MSELSSHCCGCREWKKPRMNVERVDEVLNEGPHSLRPMAFDKVEMSELRGTAVPSPGMSANVDRKDNTKQAQPPPGCWQLRLSGSRELPLRQASFSPCAVCNSLARGSRLLQSRDMDRLYQSTPGPADPSFSLSVCSFFILSSVLVMIPGPSRAIYSI